MLLECSTSRNADEKFLPHAMTGTPEARAFLGHLQQAGYVLHATDVTVFDDGYPLDESGQLHPHAANFLRLKDDYSFFKSGAPASNGKHGMEVTSLIAGLAPIGVGARARIAQLLSIDELQNFNIPPLHWLPVIESNDNYKLYEIIVLLHLARLADEQGNLNLLTALQAYASAKYPNLQFIKDTRLFRQTKQ